MRIIFIHINFICFFCILKQSFATGPTKHVYFQIDEFIKQLMTSEKFDELADIIADRAAQKIKNMGVDPLAMSKSITIKKTRGSEEKNGNEDSENSKLDGQHYNKNTKMKLFGKIDTQAFLKKHPTSKEFELNFKHLTEELRQRPDNRSNSQREKTHDERHGKYYKNNKHSDDDDKYGDSYNVKNEETNKKNIDSKSLEAQNFNSKEYNLSGEHSHEKSTFHEDDKKGRTSGEFRMDNISESREENPSQKYNSKSRERSNSLEDRTAERTFKKPNILSSNEIVKPKSPRQDKPKISSSSLYSSKEILEIGINRAVSDDNDYNDDGNLVHRNNTNDRPVQRANTDSAESTNSSVYQNITNTKQQTKSLIHVENGKLYTFNSSPDYAEYHENLNKKT